MSGQDIQKLQAELESLRKENQQLKVAAYQYSLPESPNVQELPVIEKEPILNALAAQLSELRHANAQVRDALVSYEEVQGALEALIPALELQLKGWANQVEHLQTTAVETENAYASVVSKLEVKLKEVSKKDSITSEKQIQALRRQIDLQSLQIERLQQQIHQQSTQDGSNDASDDPFTNLNIFDP